MRAGDADTGVVYDESAVVNEYAAVNRIAAKQRRIHKTAFNIFRRLWPLRILAANRGGEQRLADDASKHHVLRASSP